MIRVALLILAAKSSNPTPLAAAMAAFADANYEQAEALALSATHPPHAGAALYLVGLARFRRGRPAAALEALEEAGRAADPPDPALWHYNKGGCLYELGRYTEAEAEYLQAAELDDSLASVSLANAGFAALDGGSPERARALAARARVTAVGAARELVADLESHLPLAGPVEAAAEYREGLAAYDAGRFEEARQHFRRATELEPSNGRAWIMLGASAFRLGARGEARSDLEKALALPLGDTDAQTAREYLAALAAGAASDKRWELGVRLGAGFDSYALQASALGPYEFPGIATGPTASALATVGFDLAWPFPAYKNWSAKIAYRFDQLAYLSSAASDRSLQEHGLALSLELPIRRNMRVGASVGGQLAFTGTSRFRGLQAAGGVGVWAALDESELTSTRLDFGWAQKFALANEFNYLAGGRADAALSQDLRLGPVTLDLGYQFLSNRIGTLQQAPLAPLPRSVCPDGCSQQSVDAFGYASSTVWLSTRMRLGAPLEFELSGGTEWRNYLSDTYVFVVFRDGSTADIDRRRRNDRRWFSTASVSWHLSRGLALSLRYDLLISRSNIAFGPPDAAGRGCDPPDFVCHQFDPANRSYDKHVLTAGTTLSW